MQIPAPSLLTWSQKDFSDKFYTVPTSPELTDWLLKAENFVWDLNIFIWWEGSTSYVRVERGSNSKHILTAVVIFITFWLICCIMSYFLWQLKCHYGLEYRHVLVTLLCNIEWLWSPPHTELSTLTCEGLAPLYKYSSYSSPDMLSPHGFQFLNMPQMLTRKIPTIATWLISFQNYWCFTRSF